MAYMRRALSEYVEHYHAVRNHQGKGNVPLFRRGTYVCRNGPVQCHERPRGLLRYYHRAARMPQMNFLTVREVIGRCNSDGNTGSHAPDSHAIGSGGIRRSGIPSQM